MGVVMGSVRTLGLAPAVLTTIVVFLGARALVIRLLARRVDAALRREDRDGALRWLSRLASFLSPQGDVVLAVRASLLAIHAGAEDWDTVRSLLPKRVPASTAATYVDVMTSNNVAWCLALTGDGERAVVLAERVVALADRGVPGIARGSPSSSPGRWRS